LTTTISVPLPVLKDGWVLRFLKSLKYFLKLLRERGIHRQEEKGYMGIS